MDYLTAYGARHMAQGLMQMRIFYVGWGILIELFDWFYWFDCSYLSVRRRA